MQTIYYQSENSQLQKKRSWVPQEDCSNTSEIDRLSMGFLEQNLNTFWVIHLYR